MKKMKVTAVAVASVLACGLVAGCDLVTTDPFKDYDQVIAEVDLKKSSDFSDYSDVIETVGISKRDMVAMFVSSGSTVMSQYGWTYEYTFNQIASSLVNRQVYIQYAKVYFLTEKKGEEPRFKDENGAAYTVAGYKAAVDAASEGEKELAGLAYFLKPDEKAKALYDLRVSFNSTIDSMEETVIANRNLDEEDDHDHDETVRTTPTGVGTENEDYFDPNYRIYVGTGTPSEGYERVDNSTATTRREAYATFLSNLRSSGLLNPGEDTSDVENLSYFKRELKSAYEGAIIEKMNDSFEDIAAENLNDAYMEKEYNDMLALQRETYADDYDGFASALDSMSDTSFLLAAPQENYGFVINILLPFSSMQSEALSSAPKDADDVKGNKFVTRSKLLEKVQATDQRGTWFSGETDYSFDGSEVAGVFTNGSDSRKFLFFEDSLNGGEDKQYEALKKYYGKYTYNGTVVPPEEGEGNGHYKLTPNKIGIDGFIAEMEAYLKSANLNAAATADGDKREGYFNKTVDKFYTTNADGEQEVDYSKFVYYEGKVNLGTVSGNELFKEDTAAYKALSIINELSFAYNTDTAGLNSYLGYSVTPNKTSFVSEFEYAAQEVCKRGAGNYMVVPSDYGWHIIYCTFSFTDTNAAFSWNAAEKETEGTFSYSFYEAMKSSVVSTVSSNRQTEIINTYVDECSTIFEERFADLSGLDQQ